jgi:starch synthase
MNQYKVWYIASEVSPFAKTGGLGDVTGAFPKSLKTRNHEVRLIMPKYKTINERKYILREVIRLKDIPVKLNDVTKTVNVKSAFLPDSKVQIYFVEMPDLFGRNGIYVDNATGKPFADNAQRFAYFCKAALETLKILSWRPDIIHCNDWHTALIPIYLKTLYRDDDFLKDIKTVFTIHNFAFQGIFGKELAPALDLDPELSQPGGNLEFGNSINLVKGAIHSADMITTVSETYAKEISTDPQFGYGLEKELQKHAQKFSGILNGVDYSVWSPENDKFIPFQFSAEDLKGKDQNKQALLTRVNLAAENRTPVFGMISRISEQKGYKILMDVMDDLLENDVRLIILGTGDKEIEKQLNKYQKKYPTKLSLNPAFDETLAHMVEAGADFFLMPSSFEPCGMNQLYSIKYGTIPIIFKTGGLADTIQEIDPKTENGNGIVFEKYSAKELIKALRRALRLFKNMDRWEQLQVRVMQEDHSWEKSTNKYLEGYEHILNQP